MSNEWVEIPSIRALLNARRDKTNEEVNPIERTTVGSVKRFRTLRSFDNETYSSRKIIRSSGTFLIICNKVGKGGPIATLYCNLWVGSRQLQVVYQ